MIELFDIVPHLCGRLAISEWQSDRGSVSFLQHRRDFGRLDCRMRNLEGRGRDLLAEARQQELFGINFAEVERKKGAKRSLADL